MKYLREYSDPEGFEDFDIEDDKVYNILRDNRDKIEIPLKKMNCRYGLGDMVELHEVEGDKIVRGRSYFAYKSDILNAIENMNNSLEFFNRLELIHEDVNDTIETKFNPISIRCHKPIGKLCRVFYRGDTKEYISMEEGHFSIEVSQFLECYHHSRNKFHHPNSLDHRSQCFFLILLKALDKIQMLVHLMKIFYQF